MGTRPEAEDPVAGPTAVPGPRVVPSTVMREGRATRRRGRAHRRQTVELAGLDHVQLAMPAGEGFHDAVLRTVRVLIFVDQQMIEQFGLGAAGVGVLGK